MTSDDNEEEMVKILGQPNMQYVPLIYQLIVCEDTYFN
jgi:hypothetical protein